MATIRKRVPRYKDGGRVPVSNVAPEPEPDVPDESDPDEAVRRAVKATHDAEALVQAALRHRPSSADEYIDMLPELSEAKRAFLKQNPHLTDEKNGRVVQQRYAEALRNGMEDDTPELYAYLLEGVRREPEPVVEKRPPPPPASPPNIRRSVPITAPVSRDFPVSMSGQRVTGGNGVTLSAEERNMAHLSYRDVPKPEAERIYAEQKLRLRRMRESGEYPERERG